MQNQEKEQLRWLGLWYVFIRRLVELPLVSGAVTSIDLKEGVSGRVTQYFSHYSVKKCLVPLTVTHFMEEGSSLGNL